MPIRLMQSNFEHFIQGIPWAGLPITFQDAIVVTESLGVEYLWIDALRIIQDSRSDWMHEAARIAQVYGNSWLNISADHAADSDGGLFRQRNSMDLQSFLIPSGPNDEGITDYCCYKGSFVNAMEDGHLRE